MKIKLKASFIILLVITCSKIIAQPVLTSGAMSFVAGDKEKIQVCAAVLPGDSGKNKTWDFSVLVNTFIKNISWNASSGSIKFPATVSKVYGGYAFYNATPTAFQHTNWWNDQCVQGYFTDPYDVIRYPFTYGNSFSDSLHGYQTFCKGTAGNPRDSFNIDGINSVSADGYGTLILPYGTINNVLRLHVTRFQESFDSVLTKFTNDEYWYVGQGVKTPLFRIYSYHYQTNTSNSTSTGSEMWVPPAAGIAKEISSFSGINPNPSNNVINIQNTEPWDKLEVINLLGDICFSSEDKTNSLSINTVEFSNGIYFVRITSNNQTNIQKVIIQH